MMPSAPTYKPVCDVRSGDRTDTGWEYIGAPFERPGGVWWALMMVRGRWHMVDFANGARESGVLR